MVHEPMNLFWSSFWCSECSDDLRTSGPSIQFLACCDSGSGHWSGHLQNQSSMSVWMHGMHTWRCFLNQDGGPPQTSPSICQVTTNWPNGLRNFFLENCSPLSMFGPPVTTCDGQKNWNHWVLSNQHWALIAEFIVLFSGSETSQTGEPGQPLQNLTLDFTWWWRCSGPDWHGALAKF